MEALKFAIGESEGLTIEECSVQFLVMRHFLVPGTNFMMYDTGEECIFVWPGCLGTKRALSSSISTKKFTALLHKHVDLECCCAYDNISKYAESEMAEVLVYTR